MPPSTQPFQHPKITRRSAIQAGAVGLLGLAAFLGTSRRAPGADNAQRKIKYIDIHTHVGTFQFDKIPQFALLDSLNLPDEVRHKIYRGNALRVLKLKTKEHDR